MKFAIAETFDSIQGEGMFSGSPMFFIRLAGCNVGAYVSPGELLQSDFPILADQRTANPTYSVCTTALGQKFLCDTDYHGTEQHTMEELLLLIPPHTRRVCFTGGEPLLWIDRGLRELMTVIRQNGARVHMETSGTLPIPEWLKEDINCWITCSPKAGFLMTNRKFIDEFKFVVEENGHDIYEVGAKIEAVLGTESTPVVYVSPVNGINELNNVNTKFALALLGLHKEWSLTVQLHKILGER